MYGTRWKPADHCKVRCMYALVRHQLFEDQHEKRKSLHIAEQEKKIGQGDVVQAEIWFEERLRFLEIRLHKNSLL